MADNIPVWKSKSGINEIVFAEEYLREHPMRCTGGHLFTVDGIIGDEEELRSDIFHKIEDHISGGAPKLINRLLETIRLKARTPEPPLDPCVIHMKNGTYHLENGFSPEKYYCINRLPVNFNPEAPLPELWLAFLADLLEPDDIPTLQEFMGYCLVPVTKAQKMLILIGQGGEGKSRVGLVMRELLGDNMNMGSVQKLEKNQFSRADLEHRLLLVDDDMQMEALPSTNVIKTIVTAEDKMDVERKGIQSYQARLYCRLLCFGNETISALHDRSVGFFRRQIILKVRPRRPGRVDAADLIDLLREEREGIFLWCLSGLRRLRENGWHFTLSAEARKNVAESMKSNNNMIEFMKANDYLMYSPEYTVTSKTLYRTYEKWCDDNATRAFSQNTFLAYLKDNQARYGIVQTNKISNGVSMVRGFTGITVR